MWLIFYFYLREPDSRCIHHILEKETNQKKNTQLDVVLKNFPLTISFHLHARICIHQRHPYSPLPVHVEVAHLHAIAACLFAYLPVDL